MLSNIPRLDSLSQLIDVNVVLILVAVRVLIQGLVRLLLFHKSQQQIQEDGNERQGAIARFVFCPILFPQLFVCPRTKQG